MSTTLLEYWHRLNTHDWYFGHARDPNVIRAGEDAAAELERIASESAEHRALYDAFLAFVSTGPEWGTEKAPLPSRPAMTGLDFGRVA